MKSITEGLIAWLESFNPEDGKAMTSINTDVQPAKPNSFSVAKEPMENVRTFISGKSIVTGHYTLMARFPSTSEADRKRNAKWGEMIDTWVRAQSVARNYPDIGAKVLSVRISTPFYLGETDNQIGLYQLTISIQYEKE